MGHKPLYVIFSDFCYKPIRAYAVTKALRCYIVMSYSLGAQHDGAGNPCSNNKNIMATQASGKETAFEWSLCSRQAIHTFLT